MSDTILCKFCGKEFLPRDKRQFTCINKKCKLKRKSLYGKSYHRKKSLEFEYVRKRYLNSQKHNKDPKIKQKRKIWKQNPVYKEKQRLYAKKRSLDPEVKRKRSTYNREYRNIPENKKKIKNLQRKRSSCPEKRKQDSQRILNWFLKSGQWKIRNFPNEYRKHLSHFVKEQEGRCNLCGVKPKNTVDMHIDHIFPVSKALKAKWSMERINSLKNLQMLCKSCNIKKGDKIYY